MTDLDPALARALDAALGRALPPPQLPADFNARLAAAIAREAALSAATVPLRARLAQEEHERLRELETGYLRLRRRTLGTLIGGAFAAGAAVTLALPWLHATFGANTPLVLAGAGGAIGLAIGLHAWLPRSGAWRELLRF
jgi:hypothetical protein